MNARRPALTRAYFGSVTFLGFALLFWLLLHLDVDAIADAPMEFALLALLALIGELFPITLPRERGVEEIGTSTTFGFAILLAFGTPAAALVFAVASVVADVVYGKRPFKIAFNVAQYTVSVAVAGITYQALGGGSEMSLATVGPVLVAGVAMFIVNDLLTGTALALTRSEPVLHYLLSDLWFQAGTAAALFAMSPIVIVVADVSPFLVPLLAIPVVAAYWGATASLENASLVQRLEEALEQEKDLSRMKDDFVGVVSHELRTPLTSIQGYIKTLLQLGDGLGDEQRTAFLEAADRQSDRLRRLIEQLLAVARLDAHVEPLAVADVAIRPLIDQVVDDLRPSAHGHTFDVRIPDDVLSVRTDEAKLQQVLSNLVENALKYSPPDTRVTIRSEERDDGIVLSVEDEGRGIPAEAHDRIFERFFQVDSSATRSVGGTGLGLYLCREMSETLGGRLGLERSTTEGTVVSLWLPRREVASVDEDLGADDRVSAAAAPSPVTA